MVGIASFRIDVKWFFSLGTQFGYLATIGTLSKIIDLYQTNVRHEWNLRAKFVLDTFDIHTDEFSSNELFHNCELLHLNKIYCSHCGCQGRSRGNYENLKVVSSTLNKLNEISFNEEIFLTVMSRNKIPFCLYLPFSMRLNTLKHYAEKYLL